MSALMTATMPGAVQLGPPLMIHDIISIPDIHQFADADICIMISYV